MQMCRNYANCCKPTFTNFTKFITLPRGYSYIKWYIIYIYICIYIIHIYIYIYTYIQ